jgi:hypothetical protein
MSIYDEAGPLVSYVEKISSASINYMTNTWVLRATDVGGQHFVMHSVLPLYGPWKGVFNHS